MPTLIFSGTAHAFAGNPRSSRPITNRRKLARFHGLASEEGCADIFDDVGEPALRKIGLSGGRLRFVLDDEKPALRIETAFHVSRRPTGAQIDQLAKATKVQWSDGCGSGSFENFQGTVLSTALAMAILNSGGSKGDIGEYFVDASPGFGHDQDFRVQFLEEDVEKTDLDYLKEAAAMGEPESLYALARIFEEGYGIRKNKRLAFENYQKAADQGHLFALAMLGLCFQGGVGTAKDQEKAVDCFARAARKGLPLGMHGLGDCLIKGTGIKADPAEGIKWYRRGVRRGDVGCMAELGECHEYGRHVPLDIHKALELYERSLADGFDAVEPAINRVKKKLKKSAGK